jgi:hypothetical protein
MLIETTAHDGERGGDEEELNYVALSRERPGMGVSRYCRLIDMRLTHIRQTVPVQAVPGPP